jgi:uncharacterized protein YbjT (DUF2867 family)
VKVLVIGANGSIGELVVDYAIRNGHDVRALVRSAAKARGLNPAAEIQIGDLTSSDDLKSALEGVEAVVFTHGAPSPTPDLSETVNYGAVANTLAALGGRKVRIALMTAIGITDLSSSYSRSTQSGAWKRRSERLVRASGNEYTIVRPGWFDYDSPASQKLVMLQGDGFRYSSPSEVGIGRAQIARVLVESLTSPSANRKTFELITGPGAEQANLDDVWGPLEADPLGQVEGVRDEDNQPLGAEPQRFLDFLAEVSKTA